MRSLAENQDVAGLHKMPTGVEGFDAITGGGLPRNRTSLILGGPGGGKTVFALQTVVNGARQFGIQLHLIWNLTSDAAFGPAAQADHDADVLSPPKDY